MRRITVCLLSLFGLLTAAGDAQAQSFNCRSADFPDEFLICRSPELSGLDERLAHVFRQNMNRLSRAEQRALDREEERWVVSRRRCGRNYDCIAAHYDARIGELTERLHNLSGSSPAARADRPGSDSFPPPAGERPPPQPSPRSREAHSADDRDVEPARPEPPRRTGGATSRPTRAAPRQVARVPQNPTTGPTIPADRASGSTGRPRIEFVDPPPAR